jgi:predicted esterase
MNPADPHSGSPVLRTGSALGEARAAVVLVHGRNAGPENILELADRLACPDVAYLAPAAAGRTWYPLSFLAERAQNEPFLSSALTRLGALVDELEREGVPRARIVLAGFSQGACLASEFVLRHPARYGGLVAFSGGLIGPPGTIWTPEGTLDGTPAFLGCSDVDAHVPQPRVDESARVLAEMGAAVTLRIYPGMGHLVNDDEIAHARAIVRAAAGSA